MGVNDGGLLGDPVQILIQEPEGYTAASLLIFGDGYTEDAGGIAKFHDDCRRVVDRIMSEQWYQHDPSAIRMNIYRQDVWSEEPGPDVCETTNATYFDSTFATLGDTCRLLKADETLVVAAVAAAESAIFNGQGGYFNLVAVLVNSSLYGGASGTLPGSANSSLVLASSDHPESMEILIHELGHAIGLADEYDYYTSCDDGNQTLHKEPMALNVTADPEAKKWGGAITNGTALPSMTNPKCEECDQSANTLGNGTVGAFEGANNYHCGAYRPTYSCKMRDLKSEICIVCEGVILGWMK